MDRCIGYSTNHVTKTYYQPRQLGDLEIYGENKNSGRRAVHGYKETNVKNEDVYEHSLKTVGVLGKGSSAGVERLVDSESRWYSTAETDSHEN